MNDFLDWFRLEELFQLLALIFMLAYIGMQMTRPESETYRRARRISVAVFLLYAGMGIYAWGLNDATELLLITLRAALAAGVAFGLALVILTPAVYLIGKAKTMFPKKRAKPPEAPRPSPSPPSPVRDHVAEDRAESERMNRIDDARMVAEQFYAEHAEFLAETLPQALFTTQVRTRFPEDVSPDQAWNAAQTLITEMVPLIKAGREKKRADEEEARKREDLAAQAEKTDDGRSAIQRITDWYQREKDVLLSLPESEEREDFLNQLDEECDRKIKDALAGAKP